VTGRVGWSDSSIGGNGIAVIGHSHFCFFQFFVVIYYCVIITTTLPDSGHSMYTILYAVVVVVNVVWEIWRADLAIVFRILHSRPKVSIGW